MPALTRSAIEIVSSNLLTPEEDTAMIWRGPILSGVIRQFYEQTLWSDLDVLLVDLPPGTSDAPLTVLQSLSIDGVVLVTMPQALATMIVRKAANLIHQLKRRSWAWSKTCRTSSRPTPASATTSSGRATPTRSPNWPRPRSWRGLPFDPS